MSVHGFSIHARLRLSVNPVEDFHPVECHVRLSHTLITRCRQNFEDGRNEVDVEGQPGCHEYLADGAEDFFITTIVDAETAMKPKTAKCDPRANSHRHERDDAVIKPKTAKCDPRANSHRHERDEAGIKPKTAKCDPRANSHRHERDDAGIKPKTAKCDPRANSHRHERDGGGI